MSRVLTALATMLEAVGTSELRWTGTLLESETLDLDTRNCMTLLASLATGSPPGYGVVALLVSTTFLPLESAKFTTRSARSPGPSSRWLSLTRLPRRLIPRDCACPRKAKQRGRSRRCLSHRLPGGHDARRPRHSLHRGLLHSRRSSARGESERPQASHRCRAGHALRGPGDHGHPFRPALPGGRPQAAHPSLPAAARPGRLPQAPSSPRRCDRVAHGPLRAAEPGRGRRTAAHRLDPRRVRPQPGDGQAFGPRGRGRLRLLRRSLALVLG